MVLLARLPDCRYFDDRFRIDGASVVDQILGCLWSDCGRPVADIGWKHGDHTKVWVKDAMGSNTDNNGFQSSLESLL